MIAAYQRISRADGDFGKDGKDKSNSIENQKELIQRYISHKESLQNLPVMDFVDLSRALFQGRCGQQQNRQKIFCTARDLRQAWCQPSLKMFMCMRVGVS